MEGPGRVVQLVPLLRLRHLGDRRFDYLVPDESSADVFVGSIVTAPFGGRSVRAVVVAEGSSPGAELGTLRQLEQVANETIPPDLLALAASIKEH